MLQRLDLPIRDVLRLLLPGALGIVLFDWTYYLYTSIDLLRSTPAVYLLGYTVVVGLITFNAAFHDWLWPWRTPWRKSLEDIRLQVGRITGLSDFNEENWGKPMYKIWIDAICREDVRGHLHYVTGLYYTSVALSVTAAVFALCSIWPFARGIIDWVGRSPTDGPLNPILVGGRILSLPAEAVLAYILARQAFGYMDDATKEGRLALQLTKSQDDLRELAMATVESGMLAPTQELVTERVHRCIALVRPVDEHRIRVSKPIIVDQFDLRDDSIVKCAHIVAYADSDELAATINGRQNLYNGPSQSRIEAFIRESLGPSLGVRRIRLQIAPAERSFADYSFGSQEEKRLDRVALDEAIRLRILPESGAVARVCLDAGIDFVLLRNGHVIGPNPAIHAALSEILPQLEPSDIVYDPFAGTGLTMRMVEQSKNELIPRCSDIAEGGVNAFGDSPREKLALVVIDPLYEDVVPYLKAKLHTLKWSRLLVCSGDVEDIYWNAEVKAMLDPLGTPVNLKLSNTFGKNLLLYRRIE